MTARETFRLDLGKACCTAVIDLDQLAAPQSAPCQAVIFQWEGERNRHHWRHYALWVQTVWQRAANVSGKSILALLESPKGKRFTISCRPGRPPMVKALP